MERTFGVVGTPDFLESKVRHLGILPDPFLKDTSLLKML